MVCSTDPENINPRIKMDDDAVPKLKYLGSIFIENGKNKENLITRINPLTPELNPSAQRCLTRFVTEDCVSSIMHFVNICVKNHQIHQLFIQFINYVW
jgi:hypothetical protein